MNHKSDIEVKREQTLVKRTKDEYLIKKKLKDHRKAVYDKQKSFYNSSKGT